MQGLGPGDPVLWLRPASAMTPVSVLAGFLLGGGGGTLDWDLWAG